MNFAKVLRTPFLQNIPNDCFCLFLYNQKAGKENKTKIQLFHLFCNHFFPKNTGRGGESSTPSLLEKDNRVSAKSDVSKVLFPVIR